MNDDEPVATPEASPEERATDVHRRRALGRIAVFGAYTAPAVLTMLTAKKAMAQISFSPNSRKHSF